MKLSEAVIAIADEMDKESENWKDGGPCPLLLRSFARELRIVVNVSVPDAPDVKVFNPFAVDHRTGIEAAKEQIRKQKLLIAKTQEESTGIGKSQVEVADGPMGPAEGEDMVTVEIDPNMPIKAKTYIGDHVYQLNEDGKLHYFPEANYLAIK